jgi:hypothetical protein
MAITHSTSKAVSGRNRPKAAVRRSRRSGVALKAGLGKNSDGQGQGRIRRPTHIPAPLRVFLGSERDAIIRVQSLLVCIGQAMEFKHPASGPYYPDIVGLAADILRKRVINLDELILDGVVPAIHGRLGD